MWLPGGTKATMDLFCYQEPSTQEPEAPVSPTTTSTASPKAKATAAADGSTKPTATRHVQMAAAAASAFSALPNPEGALLEPIK
jgi:hypothetical protein